MRLSPVNPGVLGTAAVVTSPALWLALVEGTLPLDHALVRFLVAVVLSWLGLSVVVRWFFPPRSAVDRTPRAPEEPRNPLATSDV